MTALSIKNRAVWALVGIIGSLPFFYLTYYMYMYENETSGIAQYFTAILGIFVLRQMLFAPPRTPFSEWLKRMSDITPGRYHPMKTGGGMKILRPISYDCHEVRDAHNGELLGFEQEMYDVWTFTKVPPHREGEMMPPIAYWRTKRHKPDNMNQPLAEVISGNGEVVGHTKYDVVD